MDKVTEFLKESNAIEGVYDDTALKHARYAWDFMLSQDEITKAVVLRTHAILMQKQPLEKHEIGAFRQCPVYIGMKAAIPYGVVPFNIENWCRAMNAAGQGESKLLHVWYEKTHPFVDGNGRTGRIFMNWQRLRVGEDLLVIHTGDEQTEYYSWFK